MRSYTPEELQLYSSCPNKYHYMKSNNIPISLKRSFPIHKYVVMECIKKCSLKVTQAPRFYSKLTWNWLKSEVNTEVFKHLDVNNEEDFDRGTEIGAHAIELLHSWYFGFFVDDLHDSIVNLTIPTMVYGARVPVSIDMVLIDESEVIPVMFSDSKETSLTTYKNDLPSRLIPWALWKESGIYPLKMLDIRIQEKKVVVKEYHLGQDPKVIDNAVRFIVQGISSNIRYPAPSDSCTTCPFKSICSI